MYSVVFLCASEKIRGVELNPFFIKHISIAYLHVTHSTKNLNALISDKPCSFLEIEGNGKVFSRFSSLIREKKKLPMGHECNLLPCTDLSLEISVVIRQVGLSSSTNPVDKTTYLKLAFRKSCIALSHKNKLIKIKLNLKNVQLKRLSEFYKAFWVAYPLRSSSRRS